ncbi:alpha/beta fold hydrolase [Sphaerimonospora sp. CA-214678]|uniref:alpha/beta fold hydrolase n=1 Tax=Sphaerimonospora sp. CA-214678 TaxID=3240029 RepID=UPI003D89B1CA
MRSWHGAAVTALVTTLVTAFVLTFLGVSASALAVDAEAIEAQAFETRAIEARAAETSAAEAEVVDTRAADAPATIEERPCPVAMPPGTTCGFLLVPERRDVPNSRTIKVGFAVRRTTTAAAGDAGIPVVFTGGGPGSPSFLLTGTLAGMFPGRDVVVIEQRGGRHSEPRLRCPRLGRGVLAALAAPESPREAGGTAGGGAAQTLPGIVQDADACMGRLQREGVDLRGYRGAEIAADVVDLRRALGYQRWNLFGVGYSTRPMLRAAALDPDGTRAVVLDSFLPAEANRYDEAAADLASAITELGDTARFDAMVARLNAAPAVLDTRDPVTRERISLRLSGDDMATLVAEALQDGDLVPIVPALIDGLADGRTGLLQPLMDRMGERLTGRDWGLYYAVQCQDEAPSDAAAGATGPRLSTVVADAAVCGSWRLPPSRTGWAVRDASTLPAPTLVVRGRLDPTTSAESIRRAVGELPGGRLTEFAGVGHAVFLSGDCGRRTITAFLDHPEAAGAAPCDPERAPHALVRPGDVLLTPAAYQASITPALLAPGAAFAIVAIVQLLAGLVSLVRRSVGAGRRRGGTPPVLSVLAGLAGVAFAGLSALSLTGLTDSAMLAVGVPPVIAWCGLLVVVATVLSGVEAFRLNAQAVRIVPVMAGLACLAWFYGWLLA